MENEKQRERLVELLEAELGFSRYMTDDERREKLADYLLANNVVVLPCKKGDVVYHLAHGYVEEEQVRCPYVRYLTNGYPFTEEDIGKTVFFEKSEAENVLKERKNEK